MSWIPPGGIQEILDVLAQATDEELLAARHFTQVFTVDFVPVVRGMDLVLGRDALGMGAVLLFDSNDRDVWKWRAALLVLITHLRRFIPAEDFEAMSQVIEEAAPAARAFLREQEKNQEIVKEARRLLASSSGQ